MFAGSLLGLFFASNNGTPFGRVLAKASIGYAAAFLNSQPNNMLPLLLAAAGVGLLATGCDLFGKDTGVDDTGNPGADTDGRTDDSSVESQSKDVDGDGYTSDVDCDDTNPDVYQILTGYPDADGDAVYSSVGKELCAGDTLPSGYSSVAGTDCDDNDILKFEYKDAYSDADGDGYIADETHSTVKVCAGDEPGDGYDFNPGEDCYDNLSYVNPDPDNFQRFNGIDTNCDGTLDIDYTKDAVTWYGSTKGDVSSVLAAGDINGDGYDDIIIGSKEYDTPSSSWSAGFVTGQAYVVFGDRNFFDNRTQNSTSAADVTITASMPLESFGSSAATLDVNNDGVPDALIGAVGHNSPVAKTWYGAGDGSGSGAIKIFYGGYKSTMDSSEADVVIEGGEDEEIGSTLLTSPYNLSDSGSGRGTVVTVTNIADVDFLSVPTGTGTVSAESIKLLHFHDDKNLANTWSNHIALGDVNGDSYLDFLLGDDVGWNNDGRGQALLVFGGPTMPANIELSDLDPTSSLQYLTFTGQLSGARAGSSVKIEDLDGDGLGDLVIGAKGEDDPDTNAGVAYVIYGQDIKDARDGVNALDLTTLGGELSADYNGEERINGADIVLDGDVITMGGVKIKGDIVNAELPLALASSDMNGDGVYDLLLSSFWLAGFGSVSMIDSQTLTKARGDSTGLLVSAADQSFSDEDLVSLGQFMMGHSDEIVDFDGDGVHDFLVSDFSYTSPSGTTKVGGVLALAGGVIE